MKSPDEETSVPEGAPPPAGGGAGVHLYAEALGRASVHQAGRDQHFHYGDGLLRRRRANPGGGAGDCPYPGLAPFGPEQARWFFGRDELVAELIDRLDRRLRTGGVQMVVGQSGAGKSSLLCAGLLARLRQGALAGSERWPAVVLTPTGDPLYALAAHLCALIGGDPDSVAAELAAGSAHLDRLLDRHAAAEGRGEPFIVIVDQFEELFTLCADDGRRRLFIDLLTHLASRPDGSGGRARPPVLVVAGVRADFYAACADHPPLRPALQDRPLLVGSMTGAQVHEAIVCPALDVGLDIEPGLIEVLLRDLGAGPRQGEAGYEAGRLPLLAHALRVTWQQRHGATLTVEGYKTTGGIAHAIATTAEWVFAGLDDAGRRVARPLLLRLVKIGDGDGANDTRRRVPRTALVDNSTDPAAAAAVIDALTTARLLTRHRDTVEITHEALLRGWPQLRTWIDTDRDDRLLHQDLEEDAALWERGGRDPSTLYRGNRLESARTFAGAVPHHDLSPAARAFLTASTRLRLRAARLRTGVIAVLTVLALAACTAAVLAVQQQSETARQRDLAIYNRVLAEADRLADADASLSAQLTLLAHRMRPGAETSTRLLATQGTALSTPLLGHTGIIQSAKFSPDGRVLAGVGADMRVLLWDVTGPGRPKRLGDPLTGHTAVIAALAFSPDGRTLVSGGGDGAIRLWDVTDPVRPRRFDGLRKAHDGGVWSMAFGRDGRTLASGGDGAIRLWDIADPAHPKRLGGPLDTEGSVYSVMFSPDGRTLAGADDDGSIRLWDIADPAHPKRRGAPLDTEGPVWSLAFSPDGRTLAGAGKNHAIRLWNVTDPAHPEPLGNPLAGHGDSVFSVAFSPDGRILAGAGGDRTVRLWDVSDPARPRPFGTPLTGHTHLVRSVAFSPDGRTLASAGNDRSIRLWALPRTVLPGHADFVWSVAFSPDGRTLASASHDRSLRLWDVRDPARPEPLGAPQKSPGPVTSTAFSPVGHVLASAGGDDGAGSDGHDGFVQLWDVSDPARPRHLGAPLKLTSPVRSMALSPDGRTLAAVAADRLIRLWDVRDPARPRSLGVPLAGHVHDVYKVVFSPDSRTLAGAGAEQAVRLWDVSDPARPHLFDPPLVGHGNVIWSLAFSPDGHTLASGSADESILLWNVTDPARPEPLGIPLTGHTGRVNSLALSSDGHTLAASGEDGLVRLWDIADPVRPRLSDTPLAGHTDTVWSLAFSPDGRTLASAGNDRSIRLWDRDADRTARRICATTRNTLTETEWRRRVGEDVPYAPPCG
ncbi:nSTAND1 domain-containing NTPase [Nonomuraea glycinis]|uniref:nSTAND1 domain-containing NTPase n=1 Tax=Nonomuraea glycinis TaxID=2047744 RepID=UPI002E158B27|nr:AAA family ATPase [Nonomuraea glycinis]